MTRIYALERLLEHGQLSEQEITEITRWPRNTVTNTLRRLMDHSIVAMQRARPCVYRIAGTHGAALHA